MDKLTDFNELSKTAQLAIKAYGGVDLWTRSVRIKAKVSVKGLALTLKGRKPLVNVSVDLSIDKPQCEIQPIGKQNLKALFDTDRVSLTDHKGVLLKERNDCRSYFPFGRRLFKWDDIDMAYFASYAFWNYFTLPRLLMDARIYWKELELGVLEAVFPDDIPTHNKIQRFYFDKETGLLLRHDYVVEVIAKAATPANVVLKHKIMSGIPVACKRLVTPRTASGKVLSKPVLLDITVHEFHIS